MSKSSSRSKTIARCALLVFGLIGCTSSLPQAIQPSGSSSPAIQTPPPAHFSAHTPTACPGKIVTIRLDDWSHTDDARAAMAEVLGTFHATHPCIQVKTIALPIDDYQTHILKQIQAGTASDLIAVGTENIPLYTESGGLANLNLFIQADPGFKPEEIYFSGVWRAGFYKGEPRAINKDFSVSAIYVNVGLFDKAGLPLPKEGWTYDDYLNLALRLTLDQNGNRATSPNFNPARIMQYGTTIPWIGETRKGWFRGFENILYSFDAHALDPAGTTTVGYLNSKKALHAWTFARDLVHKYHVSPTVTELSALTDNQVTLFSQGRLAMVGAYWGPWFQDTFNATPNLKWTFVPLPTGPGGHKGIIMWLGWGINPKTAHPRETWQVLKWLTTEPGQSIFTRRALTQIKSLAAQQQRINDPFWGVFLAETAYVDRLDDTNHPRFFACVAAGPAATLLYRTWEPGGDQLDLQAELDKLAQEADRCLATH